MNFKWSIIICICIFSKTCYSQSCGFIIPLNKFSPKEYVLYPNGDTAKVFKKLNSSDYESWCFCPNGDTSTYHSFIRIDNRQIITSIYWEPYYKQYILTVDTLGPFPDFLNRNLHGDTNYYYPAIRESIEIDYFGDTVRYEKSIDDYLNDGIHISPIGRDLEPECRMSLKTKWDVGFIEDILNKKILYINKKGQIVSEDDWILDKNESIKKEEFGCEIIEVSCLGKTYIDKNGNEFMFCAHPHSWDYYKRIKVLDKLLDD
ncbi:MAG: hypothetical protein HRT58_20830 [Crocinitomicaceae bacterium]|nr:hypothetical protein [Flavobacteriales bacterium]NQZ38118.1 hypothetical protein [Crocinitomicaceae bacterium]